MFNVFSLVAYQLYSSCIPVVFQLHTSFFLVAYQLFSSSIPVIFQSHTSYIQVAYQLFFQLHTIFFQLHSTSYNTLFYMIFFHVNNIQFHYTPKPKSTASKRKENTFFCMLIVLPKYDFIKKVGCSINQRLDLT